MSNRQEGNIGYNGGSRGSTTRPSRPANPTEAPPVTVPPVNPDPTANPQQFQDLYNAMIYGNQGYTPLVPGQHYPGMFPAQSIPNVQQPGHAPTGFMSSLFNAPVPFSGGMFGNMSGGGQQ